MESKLNRRDTERNTQMWMNIHAPGSFAPRVLSSCRLGPLGMQPCGLWTGLSEGVGIIDLHDLLSRKGLRISLAGASPHRRRPREGERWEQGGRLGRGPMLGTHPGRGGGQGPQGLLRGFSSPKDTPLQAVSSQRPGCAQHVVPSALTRVQTA